MVMQSGDLPKVRTITPPTPSHHLMYIRFAFPPTWTYMYGNGLTKRDANGSRDR